MDGIPQSGFTIDYTCFVNHDNVIIIGRHKEYNDSIPTQCNNFVEVYISHNNGVKWLLLSKFPFEDLIHCGNTIKSDTGFLTSLFSQNGDAYLLNINYNPEYSAKLTSTGKMKYSPIAFNDNLLYSYADFNGEHNLITMDSTYHVINCVPSPPLSQCLFGKEEMIAIKRYVRNNNMFALDKNGQWDIFTCPVPPSFIVELEDGICISGVTESNGVEVYLYTQSIHNPLLIYSSNNYTFVKELITDKEGTIIMVLGYKSGMFMRYKLVVSNNSGKDWKTFDIPNSELYSACSIYRNHVYIFLTNNELIRYSVEGPDFGSVIIFVIVAIVLAAYRWLKINRKYNDRCPELERSGKCAIYRTDKEYIFVTVYYVNTNYPIKFLPLDCDNGAFENTLTDIFHASLHDKYTQIKASELIKAMKQRSWQQLYMHCTSVLVTHDSRKLEILPTRKATNGKGLDWDYDRELSFGLDSASSKDIINSIRKLLEPNETDR